ncbi:hypothetical protein V6N13_115727 [Hibiscus sabdariffa]|uniref:Uncharacterized protein n=1 Tax=Hibiscus sabdariffa TaxID=183260 RepID=A0ABR2CSM3_9ROSI
MVTKPLLFLILCSYLILFPHAISALKIAGDGNTPSKAGVNGSRTKTAPSWSGQTSAPPAKATTSPSTTVTRTESRSIVVTCGSKCL